MVAETIMALKVLDISNGDTIGAVTGMLIDGELKI